MATFSTKINRNNYNTINHNFLLLRVISKILKNKFDPLENREKD